MITGNIGPDLKSEVCFDGFQTNFSRLYQTRFISADVILTAVIVITNVTY